MSEKNTMTRNAMLFLPAKLAEGVLLMAMSSLYSHILTKSAVGLFNATNMMVNFTFLLIAAWMSNSNTRYVAEEYKKDRAARLFSTIAPIYVLLCAVTGAVCIGIYLFTRETYYLLGAVMFCTYSAFTVLNNTMVQLSIIRPAIILSLTSASLKLLLAILFVGGKSGFDSPTPALLANILADGIGSIGAVIALGMPHVVRLRRFSQEMLKKLLAFGVPLMGVALCTALLNLIDRFLVLGIYGDEVFAVYSSNVSIPSSIFNMLSVGVLRGVYPAVLRAWRESGRDEARGLLNAGVRLYMLVAFPAAFGLTAVALPFTRVFFASGYDAGAPAIGLMSFTMVFMGLTEYANKGFELEQNTRPVILNSALATIIKIVSSVVLIRAMGFMGGAVGSVIALASYFLITSIRVRRYFMWHVSMKSFLRIFISAALCGVVAFACTLLPMGNLFRLIIAIAAGGLTYRVCIVLSGEAREEMTMLVKKLHRS